MTNHQAAINALEQARKDAVAYLKNAPQADMQKVREFAAQWGCTSVFMGASLCVYAPGTVARFCIDLETLEVREIIKH